MKIIQEGLQVSSPLQGWRAPAALGHKDPSPQTAPGYEAAQDTTLPPTHPRAFTLETQTRTFQAHGTVLSLCPLSWAALPSRARASPRLAPVGVPLPVGPSVLNWGGNAEQGKAATVAKSGGSESN